VVLILLKQSGVTRERFREAGEGVFGPVNVPVEVPFDPSFVMSSQEDIINLIKALIRAKKTLRLYDDNNPVYIRMLDDIFARISSILDYREPIVLRINQYDIVSDDEIVYQNEDKTESLALFFFKDGIREITFHRALPRTELEEFLKIMSLDFQAELSGDDIVTLLWENDFRYIRYIVDDSFLLDDETYEERAVGQAKRAAGGSEEIMRVYRDAFEREDAGKMNIVPMTNDDLRSIVQEIENEPTDRSRTLIQIFFEVLPFVGEESEYEDIALFVRKLIEFSIVRGNLEAPVFCLEKLARSLEESSCPEEAAPYLRGIFDYVNSAHCIHLFGEALEDGAEFHGDSLKQFSALLRRDSIPHLLTILGGLKNIRSRKIAVNMLSEVGKRDLPLLARGLEDGRWYVVRNVIHILRRIGDEKAIEYLSKTVHHPDDRVKKETIRALGEFGSEDVLPVLTGCMSHEEEPIRVASARAIGLVGTDSAKASLLETVKAKRFREKSFSEKKEILGVLSKWRDDDVREYLEEVLRKKSFFRKRSHDETRAAAAHCAGLLCPDRFLDILRKLRNSRNSLLREYASMALKKRKTDGRNR
jgi:hypothetical protein